MKFFVLLQNFTMSQFLTFCHKTLQKLTILNNSQFFIILNILSHKFTKLNMKVHKTLHEKCYLQKLIFFPLQFILSILPENYNEYKYLLTFWQKCALAVC